MIANDLCQPLTPYYFPHQKNESTEPAFTTIYNYSGEIESLQC